MLFPLGRLVATPAAIQYLAEHQSAPMTLVFRHVSGDFGDLGKEDVYANKAAIAASGRILSAYHIAGTKLYVITEADRSMTTVLLASEY